ncbi:hypothetical protein [Nonomuraea fuscirosea]|uniref:hypothetical protein n=1 Tax=Nonomuraea fuscirosea TaxID=1291556 RepID=UPI0033DC1A8C
MLRILRHGRAAIAAAAIAALTLTAAVPASAAAPPGEFTLYSSTTYTNPVKQIVYDECAPFIGSLLGRTVGSFTNAPPPDCQVVLHALNGDFVLCAGRGVVPPGLRQVYLYSIRSGTSVACPV